MVAALAVAISRGLALPDALRLAVAAGAPQRDAARVGPASARTSAAWPRRFEVRKLAGGDRAGSARSPAGRRLDAGLVAAVLLAAAFAVTNGLRDASECDRDAGPPGRPRRSKRFFCVGLQTRYAKKGSRPGGEPGLAGVRSNSAAEGGVVRMSQLGPRATVDRAGAPPAIRGWGVYGRSLQATPGPLTVLVADAHDGSAGAITQLLETEPGVSVVGVAGDRVEAARLLRRHRPNVLLLDTRIMDGRGLPQLPLPPAGLPRHADAADGHGRRRELEPRGPSAGRRRLREQDSPMEGWLSALERPPGPDGQPV